MITKSRKKNNKLVSTPPSPKRLQLFPINFTYFFQIIDFTILTSVPTEPRADIRLIQALRVSMIPACGSPWSHCVSTLVRSLSGSVIAFRLASRLRSDICHTSVLPAASPWPHCVSTLTLYEKVGRCVPTLRGSFSFCARKIALYKLLSAEYRRR